MIKREEKWLVEKEKKRDKSERGCELVKLVKLVEDIILILDQEQKEKGLTDKFIGIREERLKPVVKESWLKVKDELGKIQEYFNKIILDNLCLIERYEITNLILTERTARFFKMPWKAVLKKEGLEHVQVTSFAFDYLPIFREINEIPFGRLLHKKYLSFLEQEINKKILYPLKIVSKQQRPSILIIDEIVTSGHTLFKARESLEYFLKNYNENFSLETSFLFREKPREPVVNQPVSDFFRALYQTSNLIYLPDTFVKYHARFSVPNSRRIYRAVNKLVQQLMLNASGGGNGKYGR